MQLTPEYVLFQDSVLSPAPGLLVAYLPTSKCDSNSPQEQEYNNKTPLAITQRQPSPDYYSHFKFPIEPSCTNNAGISFNQKLKSRGGSYGNNLL